VCRHEAHPSCQASRPCRSRRRCRPRGQHGPGTTGGTTWDHGGTRCFQASVIVPDHGPAAPGMAPGPWSRPSASLHPPASAAANSVDAAGVSHQAPVTAHPHDGFEDRRPVAAPAYAVEPSSAGGH
jgi:hypothetical protein